MTGKNKTRKQSGHGNSGKGRYKSAITGRFVTSHYGKGHPRTTYKLGD